MTMSGGGGGGGGGGHQLARALHVTSEGRLMLLSGGGGGCVVVCSCCSRDGDGGCGDHMMIQAGEDRKKLEDRARQATRERDRVSVRVAFVECARLCLPPSRPACVYVA